jgi:hypothetical protein
MKRAYRNAFNALKKLGVPAIDDQLKGTELVKYFDYTIEEAV